MNKIKGKLERNQIFVLGLMLIVAIKFIYIMNTTANVPIMDFWRYANKMIDDIFNGGLTFAHLWEPINGQRGFLVHLLFAINVIFFDWNTRIECFIGVIVNTVTCIMLYRLMIKTYVKNDDIPSNRLQLFALLCSGVWMTYAQWELETLEFSMGYSLIVMMVIVNCSIAQDILSNLDASQWKSTVGAVVLALSMCFVMSAFFPALVVAICFAAAFQFIYRFGQDRFKYISYYVKYLSCILIAMFAYFYGMVGLQGDGYSIPIFIKSIFNGQLLKRIIYYLPTAFIHVDFFEKYGSKLYVAIGIGVLILYILAVYLFFKEKWYTHTFIPLMFIIYSVLVGILLSYARGEIFGAQYMVSSRYAMQSKIGMIGCLMILCKPLLSKAQQIDGKKLIAASVICCSVVCLFGTFVVESKISPYRRELFENAIEYMKDIDSLNDEQLTIFQDTPENIRSVIPMMEQYHLGVFRNDVKTEIPMGTYRTIIGAYDDGWVSPECQFEVHSGEQGIIKVIGYIPGDNIIGEQIIFKYNEEEILQHTISSENLEVELHVPQNTIGTLEIISAFTQNNTNGDIRTLSFILNELKIS